VTETPAHTTAFAVLSAFTAFFHSARLLAFTWTVGSSSTGGSCHVAYSTTSQWAGGFTASVTITNTSSTALSGWTLAFTFPGDQHITNGWNGTPSQTGENVRIASVSYNGTIPAGGSTSLGFQGTWTTSDAAPTAFTVNGAACG